MCQKFRSWNTELNDSKWNTTIFCFDAFLAFADEAFQKQFYFIQTRKTWHQIYFCVCLLRKSLCYLPALQHLLYFIFVGDWFTCTFLCAHSTGCLPTLATIPVWIGLYRALSNVADEVACYLCWFATFNLLLPSPISLV